MLLVKCNRQAAETEQLRANDKLWIIVPRASSNRFFRRDMDDNIAVLPKPSDPALVQIESGVSGSQFASFLNTGPDESRLSRNGLRSYQVHVAPGIYEGGSVILQPNKKEADYRPPQMIDNL
jgi:hypothetical protein